MTKVIHQGHRSRLTGKVREGGVLYDHETLEVLLFNACPRKDLNSTAHLLLDRFGDLYGVMHASVEELCSVDGVGRNMAEYIHCLSAVLDNLHSCESFAKIKSTAEFLDYVRLDSTLKGGLHVYFADKDGRIRRKLRIDATADKESQLKKFYAVLAVSRPYGVFACVVKGEGDCLPTSDDDDIAEGMSSALGLLGARFYDYCIVGEDGQTYSYFVHDRGIFGKKAKRGEING